MQGASRFMHTGPVAMLSLLNSFMGLPMPRSESLLADLLFLAGTMKPRSEVPGRRVNGSLSGAARHYLAPCSENFVVMRFDASLAR